MSWPSFTSLSLEAERLDRYGVFSYLSHTVPKRVNLASDLLKVSSAVNSFSFLTAELELPANCL